MDSFCDFWGENLWPVMNADHLLPGWSKSGNYSITFWKLPSLSVLLTIWNNILNKQLEWGREIKHTKCSLAE